MKTKVININNYKKLNTLLKDDVINPVKDIRDFYSDSEILSDNKIKENISLEAIISYLIDNAININDDELQINAKRAEMFHECIMFYGVKYYLSEHHHYPDKQNKDIFDYLVANYSYEKANTIQCY